MKFEDLQQYVVVKRPTSVRKNITEMNITELREAALLRKDTPKNDHVRIYLKLSQFRLEGATFNIPVEKEKQALDAIPHALSAGNFDDALLKAQQRLIQKQAKPVKTEPTTVSTPSDEYTFEEEVTVFEQKKQLTADEEIMMAAGDYLL